MSTLRNEGAKTDDFFRAVFLVFVSTERPLFALFYAQTYTMEAPFCPFGASIRVL